MISTLVQNDNSRKKKPTAFISEGLRSKLDVCCWYFSDSWIMFCCQTLLYSCWKYPDVSFTFGWVSTKIKKNNTQKNSETQQTAPRAVIFDLKVFQGGFSLFHIGSAWIFDSPFFFFFFWMTWKWGGNPNRNGTHFSNELKNICLSP